MNLANWTDFYKSKSLLLFKKQLIKTDYKIFTMGSCFAHELFSALSRRGYITYPKYIEVDIKQGQIFDKVPFERDFIAHYDTFNMLQEIESALSIWSNIERSEGFYDVKNAPVNKMLKSETVFQDPYRKLCYAKTKEMLSDLSENVSKKIYEGLDDANLCIFTLGLIEVWRGNVDGRFFCRPPGTGYGGGNGKASLHVSTYEENYANLTRMLNLILERYPNMKFVISVSPVPLQMTYRNMDVYTANMESKSILRAVAGAVSREYESVTYFPSYEMANLMPSNFVYEEDGRHVRREFADKVIATFLSCCG